MRIEREAQGSKDYLNTNGMMDTLEDPTNNIGCPANLNYATQNVGLDNPGGEYDECDALLPQCKQKLFAAKENDHKDTKCHTHEDRSDDFFRLKNEQNMCMWKTSFLEFYDSSKSNGHTKEAIFVQFLLNGFQFQLKDTCKEIRAILGFLPNNSCC